MPTKRIKVGLDVDGVLADFGQGFINKAIDLGVNKCCFPEDSSKITKWMFPCDEHFKYVWDAVETDTSFWLNLPPLPAAQNFFLSNPWFIPELYLTKRHVPSWVTSRWLERNGFPVKSMYGRESGPEVITVDAPEKKIQIVQERCDVFVDDLVSTVKQMRAANIDARLYSAPYQVSENLEGLPVIYDLSEIFTELQKEPT
jgi:hypothetical protein